MTDILYRQLQFRVETVLGSASHAHGSEAAGIQKTGILPSIGRDHREYGNKSRTTF